MSTLGNFKKTYLWLKLFKLLLNPSQDQKSFCSSQKKILDVSIKFWNFAPDIKPGNDYQEDAHSDTYS